MVTKQAVYQLEGTLLEACSCGVLCPCWIGEDPDGGECFAFVAYHFDRGTIKDVDVSGLNAVIVAHLPGNVLTPKSWQIVFLVDDRATEQQKAGILSAYTGELGGPLADLAGLVGEVRAVQSVPISHKVVDGKGTLSVPGIIDAEMAPYTGSGGGITTLRDSIFSTVPGSAAYVSKASKNHVSLPQFGLAWDYEGRNAIQSDYKMEFEG